MSVDKVHSFLREVEKLKSLYASMETVTVVGSDGAQAINLGTIIWLSHKKVDEKKEVLFRSDDLLLVLRSIEKFDLERFRDVLLNINKVIKYQEFNIVSRDFSNFDFVKEKENWTRDLVSDREGWPAYILIGSGKRLSELLKNKIDEINWSLRANIEPYEDLNDLSSKYLFPVGGANSSRIYAVAPIYIKIERTNLTTNGTLEIEIKCHKSVDVNALKTSIIWASQSANVDRFQLRFKQKEITKEISKDDFFIIKQSLERKLDNIKGTRIYLFYKDDLIHEDWINPTKQSEEELKSS